MKIPIYTFLFLLTLLFQKAGAQSIIVDDNSNHLSIPVQSLQVIKDSLGVLGVGEIIENGIFFPSNNPINASSSSYYWIKLTIHGSPNSLEKHVLEIENKDIELLELYRPINDSDYEHAVTGTLLPFTNREYQHINFVFDIDVNYEGSRDFYLRTKSQHPIYFKGSIKTQSSFSKHLIFKYLTLGVFYGTLCLLLFYNSLLYITRKKIIYAFVALLILAGGFVALILDGSGFVFIWNNSPSIAEYAILASPILLLGPFILLSRSYLLLPIHFPKLDQTIVGSALVYLIASSLGLSAAHPFFVTQEFGYIKSGIYALPYLLVLIGSVLSWERKTPQSNYFTIGLFLFFLGFGIKSLAEKGLYSQTFMGDLFLQNALKIGFILFLTFIIKGLSEDLPVVRRKNELLTLEEFDINDFKILQSTFLPSKEKLIETLKEYFVFFKPISTISNDYYFVHFEKNTSHIVVVEIDSNNWIKSLAITLVHGLLQTHFIEHNMPSPNKTLETIKTAITKNPILKNVTFSIGVYTIDKTNNVLTYSSHGVFGLLILDSDTTLLNPTGNNINLLHQEQISLQQGQKLYLYTKGIPTQTGGESNELFTAEKTIELITDTSNQTFGKQYTAIKNALEEWKGATPQSKDFFLLGLKI